MKPRNPVARHARQFNRAAVMRDRKRASKRVRGSKHRNANS